MENAYADVPQSSVAFLIRNPVSLVSQQCSTKESAEKGIRFRGFEPLTANYVYCPNQFFDVCLPHFSRGVVRLVAYMLRQTLGFRDANGNPINEDVSISYSDFIKAGISRGSIRTTVDEAVAAGFIICVQEGIAKSKGRPAQTARYRLHWATASEYVTDPKAFDGFYTGNGCRSPIPNAFFDQIAPRETLAVVKVVSTVLRFTVGYENQFGRREQAPLSYSAIQKYSNLTNRTILAEAIRHAIAVGYIQCVQKGYFSSDQRKQKAGTYAVKWLDNAKIHHNGSKRIPAVSNRSKRDTSIGSKQIPVNRFKIDTSIKTDNKNTFKQPDVAVENQNGYELLVDEGIGKRTAAQLSKIATCEEIQNQLKWLDSRNPQNRPAMLCKAIEENWAAPTMTQAHAPQQALHEGKQLERISTADKTRDTRHSRHSNLLSQWHTLSSLEWSRFRKATIDKSTSSVTRTFLIRQTDLENPPMAFLETMALEIETGESS